MKVLFLINSLICILIFAFVFIKYVKNKKISGFKKTFQIFLYLGVFYFISSILSIYWLINPEKYISEDFLLIYSIIILFQTFFLFNFIYLFRKNRKIFLFFIFYTIIFSSSIIDIPFSLLILICSFFILLILFTLIISISNFEKIGKLGIVYSSFGLILHILFLFNKDFYFLGGLFSNILFFIFLIFSIFHIEKNIYYFFHHKLIRKRKENYIMSFLKYFIFIVVIVNFVFIGTVTVHEAGHFITSKAYGCQFVKIVYEQDFPHTETLCNESFNAFTKVILGGILLPILISILLYFTGGTFIKEISLLIFGFNLILSYQDIIDLGFSKNISLFFFVLGIISSLVSIGLLAKSKTNEEEFIQLE